MNKIVELNGLIKCFRDVLAVDNLSLSINQGEIYGFLGLNGAGKTTTIRMLLGMIRPSSGFVRLFDQKMQAGYSDIWSKVGYLVDVPSAYPDLTVRENLEITRRLYGVADVLAVDRIMDKLAVTPYADRRARTLSHGNSQRLGLARALIHEPELVILDEPANGLDPAGIVEIREMLRNLSRVYGTTVLMSSHILDEVARLATRIGIIHEGHLIEELDTVSLEQRLRPRLVIDTRDNGAAGETLTAAGFNIEGTPDGIIEINDDRAVSHPDDIAALLMGAGARITQLHIQHDDLESHFMRIIGGNGDRK
ncbi:MAG: ABC transporter ATP-binding protein [Dehalococcoidales bacterium]|nr:ABC transporter ATP-binding protein [Dehalococcoidales bacterium]